MKGCKIMKFILDTKALTLLSRGIITALVVLSACKSGYASSETPSGLEQIDDVTSVSVGTQAAITDEDQPTIVIDADEIAHSS